MRRFTGTKVGPCSVPIWADYCSPGSTPRPSMPAIPPGWGGLGASGSIAGEGGSLGSTLVAHNVHIRASCDENWIHWPMPAGLARQSIIDEADSRCSLHSYPWRMIIWGAGWRRGICGGCREESVWRQIHRLHLQREKLGLSGPLRISKCLFSSNHQHPIAIHRDLANMARNIGEFHDSYSG